MRQNNRPCCVDGDLSPYVHCSRKIARGLTLLRLCLCVGAVASVVAAPASAEERTRLYVTVDGGSLVKLMQACVASYIDQGIPLEEASKECSMKEFPVLPDTGLDGGVILAEGDTTDVNIPVCSGKNIDETTANILHDAGQGLHNAADSANESMTRAAERCADEPAECLRIPILQVGAATLEGLADVFDAAGDLADDIVNAAASIFERVPDQVSGCEEAAAFIGRCNAEGWTTGPCEVFRKQLDGCADPLVALVDPDQAPPCRMTSVDGDVVEEVALQICAKDARVAPDQDPCQPTAAIGLRHSYRLPGDADRPVCSDPQALVQPEDCLHELNVIEFGADIDDVIREAQDRLGGPVVVLPAPPPPMPLGGSGGGDPKP